VQTLTGFPYRRFGTFAIGDVFGDRQKMADLAIRIPQGRCDDGLDILTAILTPVDQLTALGFAPIQA